MTDSSSSPQPAASPAPHSSSASACPIDRTSNAPACPVDHEQHRRQAPTFTQSLFGRDSSRQQPDSTPKCPVDHGETPPSTDVNPLNMMPHLSQDMHSGQTTQLSTERELSTIPRSNASAESVWEYPSPQQFYNALARKNMPAPEEYVDVMVDIHNFLNEGAWNQVLKWESRHKQECPMPRLARLQGRPRDLSPLARISSWIHGVRPFDRHDWYVDRCGKQVRYVIDYYEGAPENDAPVFNLVVRPAIDDFASLADRAKQLWDDAKEKYF
ncbi:holocytochrome c synthase [Coemansia thaxteri]|uniref:Holocytochrome c-type synthase n=1 Tax=Coemansia thaxteri TaxID=2663907 RepID=A0A9W8BCH4_9FUNG|nr:holocytochrome c synthase [Coemansia thaxteri]KAJ2004128.1 holocytochrome c synthase [Coemansia thaxteri]KAJ2467922.1 holocytochrome c synthase [Coemansia sp. RSA 2322]KAJ2485984.1 holocytochrome c synthase [Coemansia sp. RSA 2320]